MNFKELYTGILVASVGVVFVLISFSYPLGTASNMGPGYYPLLVAIITVAAGLSLIVKSLWK